MNPSDRANILALMERHGIAVFAYEGPDGSFLLEAGPGLPYQQRILAHAPGIFLWSHPSRSKPADFPRQVRAGDIIGWLKTGALIRPVLAQSTGWICRPEMADGSIAGYGDRLF